MKQRRTPPGAIPAQTVSPSMAPLVLGVLLFAALVMQSSLLNDGDTLWQIRAGEWVLANGSIPHADPFSYTATGQRWFTHEWLSETLMALADWAAGLRGVMVLASLAAATTAGMLFHHLRRFMTPLAAFVLVVVALANMAPSMLARPHALAWPLMELWCAGLVIARADGRRPSWWLLPVMMVWANLHGSFMIGLLLGAGLLVEAVSEAGAAWRRPMTEWGMFVAAAVAAATLNPDLFAGVLFPLHLLGLQSLNLIGEWQPTAFGAGLPPLEIVLLLALGAGLLGRITVPPLRVVLFLALIHAALSHGRHDQLVGLLGALLLAPAIGRASPPVFATASTASRRVSAVWMAVLAVLVVAVLGVRLLVPLGRDPPTYGLLATLDRVPAELRAQPVLNDYSFGGELIWRGIRPFIDSRADLYGDAFVGRYRAIAAAKPSELAAALREFHIAWTVFPPDAPVVRMLDRAPGWHRLLADDRAVVHIRDGWRVAEDAATME